MASKRQPVRSQPIAIVDPDLVTPTEAVLIAARLSGCTCKPDIQLDARHQVGLVAHDHWCALLRAEDQN